MKKIFMIALMAVAALTANAQNQAAGTFSLTPHGGIGYGNMTNTSQIYVNALGLNSNMKSMADYLTAMIGGEARYQMTDVFGLSLGLDYQYSQSARTQTYTDFSTTMWIIGNEIRFTSGANYELCPEFHFINVPVLAHFNFGKHFGAKVGLQTSFLVDTNPGNGNLNTIFNDILREKSPNFGYKDFYKTVYLSLPVGFSYTFSKPIVIDLRYNIPLTKMNDFTSNDNMNFHNVTLTAGYRFDFGK